ncbi:hypothetical protein ABZY81_16620 [Streptomyces sp. NPDC006514]|uniref:hypothetical protein n=1 Tax=Streptomyces sp. NPDC006514 TaxID=3154308 RepID=UPI0033A4E57D
MIAVLLCLVPFVLLALLVKGIQLVARGARAGAWTGPSIWAGSGITAGVLTICAYVTGAFAGWGGMDKGEACGEDVYDSKIDALHQNDPPFPLHSWCNAEIDLVPSWVNPTVAGLAVLSGVCLVMAAVLGAARVIRKKSHCRVGMGSATTAVAAEGPAPDRTSAWRGGESANG